MDDLIRRQEAIDALAKAMPSLTTPDGCGQFDHDIQVTDEAYVDCMQIIHELPSAQPEQLTDKEKRIFLAAMNREEKVCKQVDDEHRNCREPNEDSLAKICREITRKVKGALWMN